MIKINKSAAIPSILAIEGENHRIFLENEIAAYKSDYSSAQGISNRNLKKLPIDKAIYGDEAVKTTLINDQHEKCCYCEAKFTDNGYGDVEHFRPKGAVKIQGNQSLSYPGYYWLAYDWDNLFFSCQKCNQKYKQNHFPLLDESKRKRYHDDGQNLADEEPLLIRPDEDPTDYIEFREEVIHPKNNSIRGRESIKRYGMDRMNTTRREYLQFLGLAFTFTQIDKQNETALKESEASLKLSRQDLLEKIDQAENIYQTVAKDSGKFAACVRAKFPHLPR